MRQYHRFRDRLVFKRLYKVADGQGGNISSEGTLLTVWGFGVYPKFGAVISAGKLGYDYDALFTIRYNSLIEQGDEFLRGTQRYRILHIQPDEMNQYAELVCKEILP